MDLEGIMLSEKSQTAKDKLLYDIVYVESKKYNKLVNITKKKQTQRTDSWQWEEEMEQGQYKDGGLRGANYIKINSKDTSYSM